jgi:hypothetical protein
VAPGATLPFDGIDVTVAQGDRLFFDTSPGANSVGDTVSWTPVITYQGASRITFDGWADFSASQGANGWSYDEYDGSAYRPMTWDPGNMRWHGSAQFLIVGENSQHADAGRDSVRAWTAPRAGTVVVTSLLGDITVAKGPGADGVKVKLARNGRNVWPASGYKRIPPGDGVPFPALTVTVAAGDTLYFHVNQFGNTSFDTTNWVPVISYES